MTWEDFAAARQVLAEERIGSAIRTAQRAEDAKVEATKAAIRKHMPPPAAQGNGYTPPVIPPRPITDEILGAA